MDDLKYKNKYLKYKKKYIKLSLEIENQLGGLSGVRGVTDGFEELSSGDYILLFDSNDFIILPDAIKSDINARRYLKPTQKDNILIYYSYPSETKITKHTFKDTYQSLPDQLWYYKNNTNKIKLYTQSIIRKGILKNTTIESHFKDFQKICGKTDYDKYHYLYDKPDTNYSIDIDPIDLTKKDRTEIYTTIEEFITKVIKLDDEKTTRNIDDCKNAAKKILGIDNVSCAIQNEDGSITNLLQKVSKKYWIGLYIRFKSATKIPRKQEEFSILHSLIYCPEDVDISELTGIDKPQSKKSPVIIHDRPIIPRQSNTINASEKSLISSSRLRPILDTKSLKKRKSKSGATSASNKCEESDLELITYNLKTYDNPSLIENSIKEFDSEVTITRNNNELTISICKQNVERVKNMLSIT